MESIRRTLEASYRLTEIGIPTGEGEILLTRVADIEELIDRITPEEFAADERIPYWAVPWRSAIALARHIAAHPEDVADRDTLEVGCGLGLPGIAAARMRARVTFADYEPHALLFAEYNYLRNIAPGGSERAAFALVDWRDAPVRQWDVILAADVLYEKRSIEPMLGFVSRALRPGGLLLVAEPDREVAQSFFRGLDGPLFLRENYPMEVTTENIPARVTLHRILRSRISGE